MTTIDKLADTLSPKLVRRRRDLHKHAESGWLELRTSSLVARTLADLGYEVQVGRQVIAQEGRMGVPAKEVLASHYQRALDQGADPEYLEAVRGGFTGVVGILRCGKGPTIGLRFDMDALDVVEAQDDDHRPYREGFASVNHGMMHACGHDSHTSTGLGLAEVLMAVRDQLQGTVKLIFQPAEEGVRGAKSMVAAGVVDDVDILLGHHVRSGARLGEIQTAMSGYAATQKFDVTLTGTPAHAGGKPQGGNNAILAAATAILNLYAIPRHAEGYTRINVGRLTAGTGRNVICPVAHMVCETRGQTTELSDYMYERAMAILEASASMYGCALDVTPMGAAQSADSDADLAFQVESIARATGDYVFFDSPGSGGSEDFSYMMRRVQELGGRATNIGVGADLFGIGQAQEDRERVLGAHTAYFDIDERCMVETVKLLAHCIVGLMAG